MSRSRASGAGDTVNDSMRSTHIERLRARIQSEDYEVDSRAVAEAIVVRMLVPVRVALDSGSMPNGSVPARG